MRNICRWIALLSWTLAACAAYAQDAKIHIIPEFQFEGGARLQNMKVGYDTYGQLNAARDNAGFTTSYAEMARTLHTLRPGFEPQLTFQAAPWTYPLMDATGFAQDTGFRPAYSLQAALRDYLGAVTP